MAGSTESRREYNFGTGMPNPETFPTAALAAAAERVLLREGTSLVRYPEQKGYAPLRELAAERFERNHRQRPPLDHIVLTAGSMQALILATQALSERGETILVEEHCYSGTLGMLRQYGRRVEGVPLDEQGLRLDALEAKLDRLRREGHKIGFVYTIATHQNPTGTILPVERRRELLELCRRHHLTVVEDDCYADVVFEGTMPPAIYTLAEPGEVVYVGSFSKILGPGVRLGYFIAPEPLNARLVAYKRDGGANALASMIVAEYLKEHLWPHIAEVCASVRRRRDRLFTALEQELGSLVEWSRPRGGLFTWVRLPDGVDTQRLAALARERGVLYGLGRSFDAAERDIAYLRLAFGYIAEDLIAEGIAVLGECLEGAAPGARRTPAGSGA